MKKAQKIMKLGQYSVMGHGGSLAQVQLLC
jgi:hypothetical protein